MIIVKLVGALGNQMFQYAYGRSVSAKAGEELKLDATGYFKKSHLDLQDDERRIPLLDKFNIKAEFATEKELRKYDPLWNKVWRKVKNKIRGYDDLYVFKDKDLRIEKNSYLVGFWPSEKYFLDISDEIKQEFTLREPLSEEADAMLQKIKEASRINNMTIAVHIRRGDYLKENIKKAFGIMSIGYYARAFAEISLRIPNMNFEFFVFSDDIAWTKEHIQFAAPMHFVSNGRIKDYEELILMSNCQHNIIANSTFSWWGAWLNQNPKKLVVAPKNWVADSRKNTDDVLPDEWIKIPS